MGAHTPGPWVIARTSGSQIYVTQPQNHAGRKPGYYAEIRRFTPNHDEVEANAHLIAAAPELLEALIHMASVAERDGWQTATTGRQLFLWDAKVAIAKAKGETP